MARDFVGTEEFQGGAKNLLKSLLAEFLATLFLNLFGCGACVDVAKKGAESSIVLIAFAFGLAILAGASAIGHISGGHINPAVTIGLLSVGKVKLLRALLYIVVQCLGAAAGSGIVKALTPASVNSNLGVTGLGLDVTPLQGLFVEFLLGFILIFVICGVTDPNKPDSKSTAPLAIGLTVTLGHLFAVDYTGSSMNPARSFGSAVIANEWADHWIYWVGPILGGIAAALLYVYVFSAPAVEKPEYKRVPDEEKEMKRFDSRKGDEHP